MANFRLPMLAAALALLVQDVALADVTKCASQTCKSIQNKISKDSAMISPIETFAYGNATHHWLSSSSQTPACVLEVGSAEDLSVAMRVIGDSRAPFAVMSGGHASNPGFSSTTGVHISLRGLRQAVFSDDKSTIEVGTGWTWAELYELLDGTGYNVVGGRTVGPGVGGFTLGGGYSWKTNQFGLTADTVKSFNVVLPNGTITRASATEQQDLFFALKGGLNRFGVVTSVELYTHQQSQVYAGLSVYAGEAVDAILTATSAFTYQNTDPKAQMITTVQNSDFGTIAIVETFYDGPTKPAIFDLFDGIPALQVGVKTQSFIEFINSIPDAPVPDLRGAFKSLPISELTPNFLAAIKHEVETLTPDVAAHSGNTVGYDIEPFTSYGEHATDSAYPHSKSPLPLNLHFMWVSPSEDEFWLAAMKDSVARLKEVAIAEGIYDAEFAIYPNYASADTTPEELYGKNLPRLREIRQAVDPKRVMDLAGGFPL